MQEDDDLPCTRATSGVAKERRLRARISVLGGVVDQIDHRLHQPCFIALHPPWTVGNLQV